MKKAYVIIALDLVDSIPGFFKLLSDFVGEYTITQRPQDIPQKYIQIFFKVDEKAHGEQLDFDILQTNCGYQFSWPAQFHVI